jgi:subtilisin family serine protease
MVDLGFFRNFDNKKLVKRRLIFLICIVFLSELVYLQFSGCAPGDALSADSIISAQDVLLESGKVPDDIADGFARGFIVQNRKADSMEGVRRLGIQVKKRFTSIQGYSADMSYSQLAGLLEDPNVRWVSPDREIRARAMAPGHVPATTGASQVAVAYFLPWNIWYTGYTGKGVSIAIIDSGIYRHVDFLGRIAARVDYVNDGRTGDPYGHGTHVAGLAAGSGAASFVGKYDQYLAGVAPKASLIDLRVLDKYGRGDVSDVIAALDWVIANKSTYNIRVVNLSFGIAPTSRYDLDPLAIASYSATIQNDLVIVTAAGNFGEYNGQPIYGGVMSPGSNPHVITVGSVDTQQTDIRSDDSVAAFSSRGPTSFDGLPKPDLVAPGVSLKSAYSPKNNLARANPWLVVNPCNEGSIYCLNKQYMFMTGTSVSAPQVAGAVALMMEANPSLTPNAVKAILMSTAQDLGDIYIHQGAGLLNVEGAVELAETVEDLDTLSPGDDWLSTMPVPSSSIAGEGFVWSQGVGWVDIMQGIGIWTKFQQAYRSGVVWGQGVGWVDIIQGIDPVWDPNMLTHWQNSLADPYSLPYAGVDSVVRGYFNWTSAPSYAAPGDLGYPY